MLKNRILADSNMNSSTPKALALFSLRIRKGYATLAFFVTNRISKNSIHK